jgi:hypothetical protein
MMAYTTRTGTRTTLARLRELGWGVVMTPDAPRHEDLPYIIDNGAWAAHQRGVDWGGTYRARFAKLVERFGHGADFIVAPDIVGGGAESLDRSLEWLEPLAQVAEVVIPVQDGMTADDRLLRRLGPRVGLFVGGSTEWKLVTLPTWGWVARELRCRLHVGRVNTARRIRYIMQHGATSFDGTSACRFPSTIDLLERARQGGTQLCPV